MVLYTYVTPGCFLYMHTPICYYLSLQLAILLNCKLLKIAIIRTKMWSLKIIQYDLICCAEQLTNNIFILKPETSSLLLLQILHSHFNNFTKHKILHWGKTNNFWTIALSGLPQNHPVCFFLLFLCFLMHPYYHSHRERKARIKSFVLVQYHLCINIFNNLCFINIWRNSWKKSLSHTKFQANRTRSCH